jgi:hypothetical protein
LLIEAQAEKKLVVLFFRLCFAHQGYFMLSFLFMLACFADEFRDVLLLLQDSPAKAAKRLFVSAVDAKRAEHEIALFPLRPIAEYAMLWFNVGNSFSWQNMMQVLSSTSKGVARGSRGEG